MEYKYPPLFKYIILLICIFMFIYHLKIMVNHQNLMITIPIIVIIAIFDYILIRDHPGLLNQPSENFIASHVTEDIITEKDVKEILEDYDPKDMQKELDNDQAELEYPDYQEKAFYQLPTDYRRPSFDLDIDCYRRGDGRGNSEPVDRYYHQDVL
jgi:hypothetical protein